MHDADKEIVFTIRCYGAEQQIATHAFSYRNLMVLIKDRIYPESFGECGGMGRCGTCCVKISGLQTQPSSMDRNEQATIQKMGATDFGIRLSCQVLINEQLHGALIEVTEEGYS